MDQEALKCGGVHLAEKRPHLQKKDENLFTKAMPNDKKLTEKENKEVFKMAKVITIKPTWAFAIMHLGKDIENRTWSTNYRGRLYIHTSQKYTKKDVHLLQNILDVTGQEMPDNFICGAIIGYVYLVDILYQSNSVWAFPDQSVLENS